MMRNATLKWKESRNATFSQKLDHIKLPFLTRSIAVLTSSGLLIKQGRGCFSCFSSEAVRLNEAGGTFHTPTSINSYAVWRKDGWPPLLQVWRCSDSTYYRYERRVGQRINKLNGKFASISNPIFCRMWNHSDGNICKYEVIRRAHHIFIDAVVCCP